MTTAHDKEPQRTGRTRTAIQKAFIELLNETDFHSISTASLMRRAGYSRGTFYLHFIDIWDIYEQTLQEYVADLNQCWNIEKADIPFSMDERIFLLNLDILRTVQRWYPFGKALLNKRGVPDLFPEVLGKYARETFDIESILFPAVSAQYIGTNDPFAREIAIGCSVMSCLVLFEWAARTVTPATTEEELIRLTESVHNGSLGWVEYEHRIQMNPVQWNDDLAARYAKNIRSSAAFRSTNL